VRAWLAKHVRVHCHFTPASGSWLNAVEQWFENWGEIYHSAATAAAMLAQGEVALASGVERDFRKFRLAA
jgi:hypothetical protein